MSYSMKFGEEVSDDFMRKISFHMLQIALNPERSIDYTMKLSESSKTCDHTQRVCAQLIERICKFKKETVLPDVKNLKFAAAWMKNMNFQDHYMRFAGMSLTFFLAEFSGMNPESLEP